MTAMKYGSVVNVTMELVIIGSASGFIVSLEDTIVTESPSLQSNYQQSLAMSNQPVYYDGYRRQYYPPALKKLPFELSNRT